MPYRIKFIFAKKGEMKFISHLDLMRLLMRALRRAQIPLKMSEGFNPHPKLSFKRALKLGVESQAEEASIGLNQFIEPEDFKLKLQKKLPKGIEITHAERNFS